MSEDERGAAPEADRLRRAYRTVTPSTPWHPDVEMDLLGWSILLGVAALFLPFLPLLLVVWLLVRILEKVAPG